jgi:hypothetical protein
MIMKLFQPVTRWHAFLTVMIFSLALVSCGVSAG